MGTVQPGPAEIDPLLVPLLTSETAEDANEFISRIVSEHAEPVIRAVIRYKLRLPAPVSSNDADAEDLSQESVLHLLNELQKFRHEPNSHSIRDVRALAAVIAHRACFRWFRRRYPERHALKNRLYYTLTHEKKLAVWTDSANRMLAGFPGWKKQQLQPFDEHLDFSDDAFTNQIRSITSGWRYEDLREVVAAIFNRIGRPLEFDKLVSALAALLSVEHRPIQATEQNENALQAAASQEPDPAWQVEKRIFLERLWAELRLLPRHQRVALLLNLRDKQGGSCVALFPAIGIASLRQLAETLEIPVETFSEMWGDLPLDDLKIAELLQLTRQQVINARKSGRERLARQLKGFI